MSNLQNLSCSFFSSSQCFIISSYESDVHSVWDSPVILLRMIRYVVIVRTLRPYKEYRRVRHNHKVASVAPAAEPASSVCRVWLVGATVEAFPTARHTPLLVVWILDSFSLTWYQFYKSLRRWKEESQWSFTEFFTNSPLFNTLKTEEIARSWPANGLEL